MNGVLEKAFEEKTESGNLLPSTMSITPFFEWVLRRYHVDTVGKGRAAILSKFLGNPDINLYRYSFNNAPNWIDPNGLQCINCFVDPTQVMNDYMSRVGAVCDQATKCEQNLTAKLARIIAFHLAVDLGTGNGWILTGAGSAALAEFNEAMEEYEKCVLERSN
jgi:hypothetical protein